MKKHNALKVVVITLLVLVLLSWILPAATFQSGYQEIGRSQVGIFDLLSYQNTVFGYFGYVALFVVIVGGIYGILEKIGAYRKMLDAIVKKFDGKEHICLAVIMILFAVLTSFCGMQLALLMLFPFVISLVLLLGYNKLAATAVTAGSVAIGLMGTTFASTTTQVLQQYLSVTATTEIWTRVIILIIGIILLIVNVLKFGKKEGTRVASDKEEFIPEAVKGGKKKKIWPLVVILDLVLLVAILGFISWSNAFKVSLFDNVTTAITGFTIPSFVLLIILALLVNFVLLIKKEKKKTAIFDGIVLAITVGILIGRYLVKAKFFKGIVTALSSSFPIFQKLLGTSLTSFGNWTLVELATVLVIAIIILKYVYKIKWDDMIEGFANGAKKALLPALLVLIIYTIVVMTTYNPFQLVIYKTILGLSKGFNVFTTGIVVILSSIINGDPVYAPYSVLPYFVSIVTDTSVYPLISVIYQTLYGVVTLVAPTSIPLMVTLAYLKVPYKDWFKYIWKLLLELIVVLFIIFTILILI